jgi:alcohol dehydrogenase (NADP+)
MSELKEIRAIGVIDYDDWLNAKEFTYVPQELRPYDIDIKIEACGICGSDIHGANGDWGRPYAPLAVGHEIVGTVVAAGPEARHKVGDRVGVGAQCDCCNDCKRCHDGNSNVCKKNVGTYLGQYPSGIPTHGGYASHVRVNSQFAFKIPENLDSIHVAPLLCGGITAFRPMITAGIKEGSRVGVNGIGGIGHMAIMFAKALGAEVTAISRNRKKEALAKELGASHYIATEEENFVNGHEDTLDLIINTGSSFSEGSVDTVLQLLTAYGQMIFITAPPIEEKLTLTPFTLLMNNISVGGSAIGSPKDIEYMLEVASKHNIKPMIETIDINEENVKTAWERMLKGDVRFRFVLTGYDKYFK